MQTAAMVERWQLWITVKAVARTSFMGIMILWHTMPNLVKFYCVRMSQVVQNKVADELKLKYLGQVCAFLCDVRVTDCAYM